MVLNGKSSLVLLVAVVLVVAAVTCHVWHGASPEGRIAAHVRDLASCLDKGAGMKTSAELLKARRFSCLFAPRCRLALRHQLMEGEYTPESASSALIRYFSLIQSATAGIDDLVVELRSSDTATAEFTARLRGAVRSGETFDEVRDLVTEWKLVDGEWRLANAEIRKIVER